MKSTELLALIAPQTKEGVKLEFKRKLYSIDHQDKAIKEKQWGEFIKDILALANGNVGYANKTGYLIIGVSDDLNDSGNRDLFNIDASRLTESQIQQKINAICRPPLPQINLHSIELEGTNICVIEIPPTPYLHETTKKLETPSRDYNEHTVFIRWNEMVGIASLEECDAIRREKDIILGGKNIDGYQYIPPTPPPSEIIPDAGELPPGSRILYPQNINFTNRLTDLQMIADCLLHGEKVSKQQGPQAIVAVAGIGGVGKTQLVNEFCYIYGQFFRGVHWLQADKEISTEIAICGEQMGLLDWPKDQGSQIEATLRAWNRSSNRLVILDDLKDISLLQNWLPRFGSLYLLITSRRANWPNELEIITHHLDSFSHEGSKDLLYKLAPEIIPSSSQDIYKLIDRLGGLPLALDLGARYIHSRSGIPIDTYIGELDRAKNIFEHPSLDDWVDYSPTQHEVNLYSTFNVSWERIGDNSTSAKLSRRVLLICGWCAPNIPIPKVIFLETLKDSHEETEILVDRAVMRLSNLGLIIRSSYGVIIHPLLHEFAIIKGTENQWMELPLLAEAMFTLSASAYENEDFTTIKMIIDHLKAVALSAQQASLELAGELWNNHGILSREIGEYKTAKFSFNNALTLAESREDVKKEVIATCYSNLGGILNLLEDFDSAEAAFLRGLELVQEINLSNLTLITKILNNLGYLYKEIGKFTEARSRYEQAIEIVEQYSGYNHTELTYLLNNLGSVHYALGNLIEAKEAYERSVQILEIHYGHLNSRISIPVSELGKVYLDLGNIDAARNAYEEAIKIDETFFGKVHPRVASGYDKLGRFLIEINELEDAKDTLEYAVQLYENSLGPDHPDITFALNDLGQALNLLGESLAALRVFERAVNINMKVYGEFHSVLAISYANISNTYRDLGNIREALKYLELAFEALPAEPEKIYPENTIILNKIGEYCDALGKLNEAKEIYLRSIQISSKVEGQDSERTGRAYGYLGKLLIKLGETEEAKKAIDEAFSILGSKLPSYDPQLIELKALRKSITRKTTRGRRRSSNGSH